MKQKVTTGREQLLTMLIRRDNNNGFSIIELLIATLLFSIMITGVSQLMSVGFDQQQIDIKQKLSALAVNNGAERFLSTIRDNCGTNSFTGKSIGGCTTGKTYTQSYNGTSNPSPMPPDLITNCPGCLLNVNFTCDNSNQWHGSVSVIDSGNNNEILASVSPAFFQPLCGK